MSDEVDLVALQQQAEALLRAEYDVSFNQLRRQMEEHDLRKAGWDAIIGRIVNHYSGPLTLSDNTHLDQFLERLDVIVAMGLDFETLLKAMESNEILKKQWDGMCMTMRLVGLDNSASDAENG